MKTADIKRLFAEAEQSQDLEKLRQANKAFDDSVYARLDRADMVYGLVRFSAPWPLWGR